MSALRGPGRVWTMLGALLGLSVCAMLSQAAHAPVPQGYAWCVDACPSDLVAIGSRADAPK